MATGDALTEGATFLASRAQERMFVLDALGAPGAYNIPQVFKVSGELDRDALERAVRSVVARHESLRTSFRSADGEVRQLIHDEVSFQLESVELDAAASAEAQLQALTLRPFDLEQAPLLRATLVTEGTSLRYLVLLVHHIVSDGWSMEILTRELIQAYFAQVAGASPGWPELPIQYADFAEWQRGRLESDEVLRGVEVWRERLRGVEPLALPTDRPRPVASSGRGATVRGLVPQATAEAVRALARAHRTTPFVVYLAVYGAWLAAVTRSAEVVVGTPVAGRSHPDTHDVVGLFVNTVALRLSLDVATSLETSISAARDVVIDALSREEVPFDRVVEALSGDRNLGRSPVYQTMLLFEAAGARAVSIGELLEPVAISSGTAKLDLLVAIAPGPQGDEILAELALDLFEPTTVSSWLNSFVHLVQVAVAVPQKRWRDHSLWDLTRLAEEWGRWNSTAQELSGSLVAAMEANLLANPAIALEEPLTGRSFTGPALVEAARCLAWRLAQAGCLKGDAVIMAADRGLELVAAMLACQFAGFIYVPVDMHHPSLRILEVVRRVGARVALADAVNADAAFPTGVEVLPLSASFAPPPGWPSRSGADDIAYTIFTSGSTGAPKGAMNAHRALHNRVAWMQAQYGLTRADRILMKTPYTFDVSVWEFLWGPLSGATTVIAPPGTHASAAQLCRLIQSERITVLHFVPSMLDALLEEPDVASCSTLTNVIVSGEALLPSTCRRFAELLPGARLHNLYGPTEAAIDVSHWTATAGPDRVPIGRPVWNTSLYVLSAEGKPLPPGIPGELVLGGIQVGTGYVGRPELTAERFVPDPFSATPGARMYLTGDLAAFRVDGTIDFLGRIDDQIKLRGLRIELGEIESSLRSHPAVAEAAARVAEVAGARHLFGYVVFRTGVTATESELASHLARTLPEYMVPLRIVAVAEIPRGTSGKVAREQLPLPELGEGERAEFVPPETPIEALVVAAFEAVLKTTGLGLDDNFFASGGDSIRVLQLGSALARAGLQLPAKELFLHQTPRRIARLLDGSSSVEAARPPEPFELLSADVRARLPPDAVDAFPVPRIQSSLIFHSQVTADYASYVLSAELECPFDGSAMQRAADDLLVAHPILRTTFELEAFGEPIQIVHRDASFLVRVHDLREADASEQARAIESWLQVQRRRRFDWRSAPLVEISIHRLSETRFRFSVVEPVLDGWSIRRLVADFFSRYLTRLGGETPPPLNVPTATVPEFVRAERDAMANEESTRFWREMLDELPPRRVEAVLDEVDARNEVRDLTVTLSPEETRRLADVAKRAGVPLKSVCMAATFKVVGTLNGSSDVIIGALFNGRPESVDADRALGLFLNPLPLRMRTGGKTWSQLARDAFDLERRIFPHRRVPSPELQARHSTSMRPFFDVLFNFVHFHVLEEVAVGTSMAVSGEVGNEQTYSPLTISFSRPVGEETIVVHFYYRPAEMAQSTVTCAAELLASSLKTMGQEPDAPHARLPLLAMESEGQPDPATDSRVDVVNAIFDRGMHTPARPALRWSGGEWTYGQLVERAASWRERVAAAVGGVDDARVAIAVDRGPEAIAAILGVLASGAAYVPQDVAWPDSRKEDVLVASRALAVAASARPDVPVGAWELILGSEVETCDVRAPSDVHGETAAYEMFTSGSTGLPKGVVVSRRALNAYCAAARVVYDISAGDTVLQFASLAFDASVEEIFPVLSAGGVLAFRPSVLPADASGFLALAEALGVTIATLPTAYWHAVSADIGPHHGPLARDLRVVILGGEAAQADAARRWLEVFPGKRLINSYGPTETTVVCTAGDIVEAERGVDLGVAIPGVTVMVLDHELQLVPTGTVGQLFVSGPTLARGYDGLPDATAAAFVPCASGTGGRMYATGDLGWRGADGRLHYAGRRDRQLKVRGFRVEPSDVERRLRELLPIREVVVFGHRVEHSVSLVAVVVPREPSTPASVPQWLSELRAVLPAHLVPDRLSCAEALPMTTSGKVDIPAVVASLASELVERGAERETPVDEDDLARVARGTWSTVLGRSPYPGASFFDLGGHSLAAMRIATRLRTTLGRDVSVAWLFETPRFEDFVARLRASAGIAAANLGRWSGEGPLPISSGQRRMWFLERLEGATGAYVLSGALRLRGPLDVPSLRMAVFALLERHEALRVVLLEEDGAPSARLAEDVENAWRTMTVEPGADLDRLLREIAERPMSVAHLPVRFTLLRVADGDHVLVVSLHHAASDGWSIGIVIRDLSRNFVALSLGASISQSAPAYRYADFAAWERLEKESGRAKVHLDYWCRTLAGAASCVIPPDLTKVTSVAHGETVSLDIDADLSRALRDVAMRHGVSPMMVVTAILAALVSRFAGTEDVSIGTPVAGRPGPELDDVVGFFVNTVVLRLQVHAEAGFRELLAHAKRVVLEAVAHQATPFDEVVRACAPQRGGESNLFSIMLSWENAPYSEVGLGEVAATWIPLSRRHALFDLTLVVVEEASGLLRMSIEYAAHKLAADTIQSFRDALRRGMNMVTEREELEVAELWRASAPVPLPTPSAQSSLWDLVAAGIAGAGDKALIRFRGTSWDGGRVLSRVERMASELRVARPNEMVAIVAEAGLEVVFAELALASVGACFVPIDPSLGETRIRAMLRAAGIVRIVADRACADLLADLQPIVLDHWGGKPEAPGGPRVAPAGVAYGIFTSGTTGLPKPVLIPDSAIVTYIDGFAAFAKVTASDVVAQWTNPSFDVSVWEIFGALTAGATLVIIPAEDRADVARVRALCEEEGVSILETVPSVLRGLVRSGPRPTRLRAVFCGGEALSADLAEEFRRGWPGATLFNMYGPTESTIDAIGGHVDGLTGRRPALGRCIAGRTAMVLDAAGNPVVPGGVGELALGGAGLALGYAGDAVKTASSFVPHPFESGGRMYLTGDQARARSDGSFEYLGRRDGQLKLRGVRVEPEEIESAACESGLVREAAVVVVDETRVGGQSAEAVALAVVADSALATVRRELSSRMPSRLVPKHVFLVPELPRLPSGKVDRAELASIWTARAAQGVGRAPSTPAELVLVEAIGSVSGAQVDDVSANVFALGIDSMSSVEVVSWLRRRGWTLRTRAIFEHPELAELAATMVATDGEQRAVLTSAPLAPMQRWYFAVGLGSRSLWALSAEVSLPDVASADVLVEAVVATASAHDSFRSRIVLHGDRRVQQFGDPAPIFVRVADGASEEAWRTACESALRELDLESGRTIAVVTSPAKRGLRAYLAVHHAVADEQSLRQVLREVQERLRGEVRMFEMAPSFFAWAARVDAAVPDTASSLAWDEVWAGSVLPRSSVTPSDGTVIVDKRTSTDGDRPRGRDLCLAALLLALADEQGPGDYLVDIDHQLRGLGATLDAENVVGWAGCRVPARIEVRPGEDLADLAVRTGSAVEESVRALLVPSLGRWRDGTSPSAPLSFNYLGVEHTPAEVSTSAVRSFGNEEMAMVRRREGWLLDVTITEGAGWVHLIIEARSSQGAAWGRELLARWAERLAGAGRSAR